MASIWVLGGANIDVCGTADGTLQEYDSNLGTIELRFGGVARNVAQTCALLGHRPFFISCFSEDHYGTLLRENCETLGMDCTYALTSRRYPTSLYLAILEENGELRLGMNDMRILEELNTEHLRPALAQMRPDDILVLDTNLNPELLSFLAAEAPCPLAMDPISVAKISRMEPLLPRLRYCKPNRIEAEALTGISITDEDSARASLHWFLARGVQEILLSLAEDGVLIGSAKEQFWLKHRPARTANVTGGGDAFLGAYLCAREEGTTLQDAGRFAVATALWTVESGYKGRLALAKQIILDALDKEEIDILPLSGP